jgi:lantibiotic modifying enzyme
VNAILRETALQLASRVAVALNNDEGLESDGRRLRELGAGLGGTAGIALMFELVRQTGDNTRDWAALSKIALMAGSAGITGSIGLFDGISGLLFVAKYIRNTRGGYARFIESLELILSGVINENALTKGLDVNADLISGLSGSYVAAAAFGRCAFAPLLEEYVAAALHDMIACQSGGGQEPIDGVGFNLGVAHGLPGLIGSIIGSERFADGIVSATNRLIELNSRPASMNWSATSRDTKETRSAWCYGAPGISAVLSEVALKSKMPALRTISAESARFSVQGNLAEKGIRDSGLCHGQSGVSLCLWVCGRNCADPGLEQLATDMMSTVARAFDPAHRFGYLQRNASRAYVDDASFLGGASGLVAAMLTVGDCVDPMWLRCLALGIG